MLNMIADNLESIVQIYKYISDKMNVDVRSWKYILYYHLTNGEKVIKTQETP